MKEFHISYEEAVKNAALLSEALPYMQRYDGKIVVIKYGGHAMASEKIASLFARDLTLLKQSGVLPVVVHGGGPQISLFLKKEGVCARFHKGLRITGEKEIAAAEKVMVGSINKRIVRDILRVGGRATGLSAIDGGLIEAEKLTLGGKDLGFVGRPAKINPKIIMDLLKKGFIPVIAPLAADAKGVRYNINADMAAGALAVALQAERLVILTDVPAVEGEKGKPIAELSSAEARALMRKGVISDGMRPKVETCLEALQGGVTAVVLDGRVPHALLLELFTDHGAGTLFLKKKKTRAKKNAKAQQ